MPPTQHTDIRGHIRALAHRDGLAQRMRGRGDILKWASALIAAQDNPGRSLPTNLPELGPSFPSATELVRALIPEVELPPGETRGRPVPGGVHHPLLHWSPVLQFARLGASDGLVDGQRIEALPHNFSMLAAWLERSMGLMPAEGGQQRDYDRDELQKSFRKRFTFSTDEFARWLIGVRGTDPVLFVMLMSREYRLALRHCPELGDPPAPGCAVADAMPALKTAPILAAMTAGEIQRLFALTRDLAGRMGSTFRDAAIELGDKSASVAARGNKIADAIGGKRAAGFAYDHEPMRVESIRKRVFLVPNRDLSKLDEDSFLCAIFGGSTDWNHIRSAGRLAGARELIASILAPKMFKKSGSGRGKGYYKDSLDHYYGLSIGDLPYVALLELGVVLHNAQMRGETAPLAARLLAIAASANGTPKERKHKSSVKKAKRYLRKFPRPGSGGRFVAVAWLDPERDAAWFKKLLKPVGAIDRQNMRSSTGWMKPIALRYLQLCFPRLYEQVDSHDQSARLMAHLATSSAAFTSDPIFCGMLRDAAAKAKASVKVKSNFLKRPPPSPLLPISQKIIDAVRFATEEDEPGAGLAHS
ncbi:hypothetical protein [Sphingomonas trueperi]|uniref:hypothetical protein n=1 Tax=Sphingomonas trueperi TaxID=53317 RepID=UPI000EAB4925